jgi:hypothetical protein
MSAIAHSVRAIAAFPLSETILVAVQKSNSLEVQQKAERKAFMMNLDVIKNSTFAWLAVYPTKLTSSVLSASTQC